MIEVQRNNFFNKLKKIVLVSFCLLFVYYSIPYKKFHQQIERDNSTNDKFYYFYYDNEIEINTQTEIKKHVIFQNPVASTFRNYQQNDIKRKTCLNQQTNFQKFDIEMPNLYEYLLFNTTHHERDIKEKYKNYNLNVDNKLKVYLVPHSHNDPGWIETYDSYYQRFTKSILMNALNYLTENPDMKFIWAEISFFSRFYETLELDMQEKLLKIVANGQLEFVTGAWVMADEATTHWYSLLIQLTEGQRWLNNNLNVTPVSSWAIDPFGHSSTMAYLLKNSGFENLLIQRTHYLVKSYFAGHSQLEFRWRQLWDKFGETELFTHMMPYNSYKISSTCGPHSLICDQFDFPQNWETDPKTLIEIDNTNIVHYSNIIINEWRQKSALFKTTSLLVPIGDDFRYSSISEWIAKHKNFQILFKYINSKPEFFTHAKFATLQEYFDAVRNEKSLNEFPTLNGDFFPYADVEMDYWTGYYSSRPYYKSLERILLHYVRSAEIVRVWNNWSSESMLDEELEYARQQLSLFQHHDAITGTATDYVIKDYEGRMLKAIEYCKHIIQQASHRLLTKPILYQPNYTREYFYIDDSNWPGCTAKYKIFVNKKAGETFITFQNSLPQWRYDLIDIYVKDTNIQVTDSEFNKVLAQISLVWSWKNLATSPKIRSNVFKLTFEIKLPPLGLTTYILHTIAEPWKNPFTRFTNTTILTKNPHTTSKMYEHTIQFGKLHSFSIPTYNGSEVTFTSNGLLQNITLSGNTKKIPINLDFIKYGSSFIENPSGAYIFSPSLGKAKLTVHSPTVIISKGELESIVTVAFPFGIHSTILRNNGEIEIRNLIDISAMDETEIAMQFSTQINNNGIFYTDSNAFQMLKRKYLSKLPIQGNYYPLSSSIFIEDNNYRLTILSAQPLGGTSFSKGNIEIMQDRILFETDNRGLPQGITDNRPVLLTFRLLIEECSMGFQKKTNDLGGFLTLRAYTERQKMLSPINKLIWKNIDRESILNAFGQLHRPLQNDMELAVIRNLGKEDKFQYNEIGVVIHRTKLYMCNTCNENSEGYINFQKLLNLKKTPIIYSTHLTFLKYIKKITHSNINISPMDIKAFIIRI